MIDFLKNCRERKVNRTIRLLGQLLAKVYDGLDPLLDMADARDLVEQRGFMHVYRDQAEWDAPPSPEQPDVDALLDQAVAETEALYDRLDYITEFTDVP